MLGADLSGEVLRGDLAVAVHQDDQRSGVLILHDERLDHMMMINPAGRGGQRRTAVLDVFVGLFLKGNVVLPEPLGGGRQALVLHFRTHFSTCVPFLYREAERRDCARSGRMRRVRHLPPMPERKNGMRLYLAGSVGILLAKSLGKRKDDVLLDAFERHGMLGVEVGLKITKHALDEGFRGGGARRDAHACNALEPLGIDVSAVSIR